MNITDAIHIENDSRCTMCGKTLDEYDKQERFGFDYYVGYGSKYDTEHVKASFCCGCFDKILDRFIDECKTSPIIGEYEIGSPIEKEAAQEALINAIQNFNKIEGTKG